MARRGAGRRASGTARGGFSRASQGQREDNPGSCCKRRQLERQLERQSPFQEHSREVSSLAAVVTLASRVLTLAISGNRVRGGGTRTTNGLCPMTMGHAMAPWSVVTPALRVCLRIVSGRPYAASTRAPKNGVGRQRGPDRRRCSKWHDSGTGGGSQVAHEWHRRHPSCHRRRRHQQPPAAAAATCCRLYARHCCPLQLLNIISYPFFATMPTAHPTAPPTSNVSADTTHTLLLLRLAWISRALPSACCGGRTIVLGRPTRRQAGRTAPGCCFFLTSVAPSASGSSAARFIA